MTAGAQASATGPDPMAFDPWRRARTTAKKRAHRPLSERLTDLYIRVFSFFLTADQRPEDHRDEVVRRMGALAERAAAGGVVMLHENEKEIFGDVPRRCFALSLGRAFVPFCLIHAHHRSRHRSAPHGGRSPESHA